MATSTHQTLFPPFTVTRAAIEQLTVLGGAVRIDIEDGGCCGTTYVFNQVDPAAAEAAAGTDEREPFTFFDVGDDDGSVDRDARAG